MPTASMPPKGIRNCNPLNLVHDDRNKWQGLASPPSDGRFCRFTSPLYGIRAAALNLIAYQDRHGINTLRGLLERWAPHGENNVEAYRDDVCGRSGFAPDYPVNLHNDDELRPIIEAMIWHENGEQPYTDAQITKALVMAGVEPAQRPMSASRTVKGGQVAAGAGVAATVAGTIAQVEPALPVLQFIHDNFDTLSFALIALGLAVLAGVGYAVWARIDDRRKGLR